MALTIERQDKQPEPRAEEIQKNWRVWARTNNYIQKEAVPVEAGAMSVSLEVWESSSTDEDNCLIYMPPIPHTNGGDILYITDQEHQNEFKGVVKKLALASLVMVQVKQEQREERSRLN